MSDFSLSTRPVATLDAEARGEFVVNVYKHLLLAIGVFMGFEAILFITGIAESMYDFLFRTGGVAWLLLMGLFMVTSWISTKASHNLGNIQAQYGGLFGMAGAEALIFAPFLYYAFNAQEGGTATVGAAAVLTAVGFACLSVVAFTTRKDLSFLRGVMMWGFGLALVAILGGVLFGFQLGIWFSVAMIGLAGASILYQTQQIMARFPNEAYVAGAVQLFGSVMMLFWYVLRLLMQLRD